MKALVSEEKVAIEHKGHDVLVLPNYIRFIISTNNEHVIAAGPHARRFFVLDVGEKHKQDHDYFNDIVKEMNQGGREALLHMLENWNLKGVRLQNFPRTAALQEQQVRSLDELEAWWFDRLIAGTTTWNCLEWAIKLPVRSLFEDYINEADRQKKKYRKSLNSFGLKMRRLCPGISKTRLQLNDAFSGRETYYVFPTLIECRKMFDEYLGCKNDWPEHEDEVKQEFDACAQ